MPKKHLGQHFLTSKSALNAMLSSAGVSSSDTILEIGPGKGVLTEALLETNAQVVAIEKDSDLLPFLSEKFASFPNFKLIEQDVLEFDPAQFFKSKEQYKIVANIPYYITGAILQHFLENPHPPVSMTLLVQKEVAERIVARDKKESILSISVKAYGNPSIIAKVPKRYFNPPPLVDSAIIHIDSISKGIFQDFTEQEFFSVVKKSFQFKRKNIFNNLKNDFQDIIQILDELNISPTTRAEDLNISDFSALTKKIFKK